MSQLTDHIDELWLKLSKLPAAVRLVIMFAAFIGLASLAARILGAWIG